MNTKFIHLALTVILAAGLVLLILMADIWSQNDRAPEQPIEFSHRLHARSVGMECTDCHRGVRVSPRAGVPGAGICLECHENVAVDRPEIKKLTRFLESGESVPWVKVHDLGWHAYFSHRRHVAAELDCSTCHGRIEVMTRVRKVRSLRMGWCVTCHRRHEAPTDCLTCHK